MNNIFLILGCAKQRWQDLEIICEYVKKTYSLTTMLMVNKAHKEFYSVCDQVIEVDLSDHNFVALASHLLSEQKVSGGLLFADQALLHGTKLFEQLGIVCDNSELGINSYSKLEFRRQEKRYFSHAAKTHYFVPEFSKVNSLQDVHAFAVKYPDGFILKPISEGGSRGVLKLHAQSDFGAAYKQVECYQADGLMCEQLIPTFREFSFDGVGDISFITEKLVATGAHPVEVGQIVPAELTCDSAEKISAHGRLMNLWVGQQLGAFHNEIAYLESQGSTAAIESNRRSGGMGIWNLAEKVFGENLFHRWVDVAMGQTVEHIPLNATGKAMSCMLGSRENLIDDLTMITAQIQEVLAFELGPDIELFSLRWLHTQPHMLPSIPQSNFDFLAEACIYCAHFDLSNQALYERVQRAWDKCLYIGMKEEKCA